MGNFLKIIMVALLASAILTSSDFPAKTDLGQAPQPPKYAVAQGEVLNFKLRQYFPDDFYSYEVYQTTKASATTDKGATIGKYYDYQTAISQQPKIADIKSQKTIIAKTFADKYFIELTDGPALSVAQFDFDGLSVSKDSQGNAIQWYLTWPTNELDLVCSDMDYLASRDALVVACTEKTSTKEDPKSLTIHIIDLQARAIASTTQVDLGNVDGKGNKFFFENKLNARIVH